jgi:hypothetical protein
MTLREYLSIPYILAADTFQLSDGTWIRRMAYFELPGCLVDLLSPIDSIEQLEKLRVQIIFDKLCGGQPVPKLYEPLHSVVQELELTRMGHTELIELLEFDEYELAKLKADS